MGNIKETFLKKYGVSEYIFLASGVIVLTILIYWFATKQLDNTAVEGLALVYSILSIGAPLSLLDWARKKVGVETREKKLMDEKFKKETGLDPDESLIK